MKEKSKEKGFLLKEKNKKQLEFSQKVSLFVLGLITLLAIVAIYGDFVGKNMSNTLFLVMPFVGAFTSLVLKTAYENGKKIINNKNKLDFKQILGDVVNDVENNSNDIDDFDIGNF